MIALIEVPYDYYGAISRNFYECDSLRSIASSR